MAKGPGSRNMTTFCTRIHFTAERNEPIRNGKLGGRLLGSVHESPVGGHALHRHGSHRLVRLTWVELNAEPVIFQARTRERLFSFEAKGQR